MTEVTTPAGAGKTPKATRRRATPSKTSSAPPTKQKPTSGKKQARSTTTSEAQKKANAANATKSTGPRTEAGKQKSAGNSLRHGLYAKAPQAILRGPYSEDPEEVAAFVAGIEDALAPRNQLEASTARDIAMLRLKIFRMDALEAGLINGRADRADQAVTHSMGSVESLELEYAWLDRLMEWLDAELARLAGEPPPDGGAPSDQPEDGFRFDVLAQLMRIACNNAKIEDLWTDTLTPKTELEWYRAFRILLDHKFPELDGLESWIFQHRYHVIDQLRERHTATSIRTANNLLEEMERTSELRGRLLKQLERAETLYRKWQDRPLAGDDGENVGTNPI